MKEELVFESSLSMEQIEKNFENRDYFTDLKQSLEEVLAYERGTTIGKTFARKLSLPDIDVKGIRSSLCLTQRDFATVIGVSSRTVESWECGRSNPSPTARNLMYLLSCDHELAQTLLTGRTPWVVAEEEIPYGSGVNKKEEPKK